MWQKDFVVHMLLSIISTHTSRVGCDDVPFLWKHIVHISTHTSRVGCDGHSQLIPTINTSISTHTSRVGCDAFKTALLTCCRNFYSHIPCGMWLSSSHIGANCVNFYSHIPCGMWRVLTWHIPGYVAFLLTHPVWDVTLMFLWMQRRRQFLLTHPVWDVTL